MKDFVPGIANFGVQFNFSSISVAILLMDLIYGQVPSWGSSDMASSIFIGCIIGMIYMGRLGDSIGRDRAMAVSVTIALLGALFSAVCSWGSETSVLSLLTVWRAVLGLGIGGIYPLSSALAYECDTDTVSKTSSGRCY